MNPYHDSPSPAAEDAPERAPAGYTILVVDDSSVDRHLAGAIVQKLEGYRAAFAANGREALDAVARQAPDLVLTDLLMPEMDGLQLVEALRKDYPTVPVVLMTGHGSEDIAIQALRRGAASYVPKKSLARDLPETLEQVLSAAQTRRSQRRVLECVSRHETEFELANDTALIPPLVSFLEGEMARLKLCEPSGLVLLGVALHEAVTNAIHHGNLGLSSELRESDEKRYYQLAKERREQGPYRDRRVFVTARMSRDGATFVVRDEGDGFDPRQLPDPTDPANLGRVYGRGLLLINTFMDRVEHNESGNQITMVKRYPC
jgi:CheY-like chemotaxis protein/anti-sigma regulatory factor (Ser/Thr protein kinase)